jgi:phage FluMu protein Com
LNIYDTKIIRCTKCNKYIGEVEYDAEIVFPKCGNCANPIPDGLDKLAYTINSFNNKKEKMIFAE